jgi:two-component system nitrate/nitrite response regulator NarL
MSEGFATIENNTEVRPNLLEARKGVIRVLIADDHPIVRDGLKKLLTLEEDVQVVGEACDGCEVLDKVQELDPDVLLLDLRMPNLDGLSALQALQQTNKRTRVIILTASEDKNEFVQAMKLGCSGIVLKQTAPELIIKSSQREREIVQLVAQGYKNKEMAEKMFISEQTVKNHLHNIFDKLGVSDRLELALYAIHKGLHLNAER